MIPAPRPTTLADLPRLLVGKVVGVDGDGPTASRLVELGFSPGTEVRFERSAPFGGPMVISLRGYQLCLRPTEARRVRISALGDRG